MALVTAPLSRRDDFPYRTLSEREIRVVVVKHARRPLENNLTCYIQHITLGLDSNYPVSVPYTALSYTWGDGKDVTSLKLQDEGTKKSGDITVTRSLVTALQTILEPRKHYTLWIDQICIDQSSTEEKGQQVQFMRWIYERATVIYVWLGPANEGSDIAMIYLKDYDKVRELYDLNPILEEALKLVFRRPYWSRTWTLQEVTGLDSQHVIIYCGHESVPLTCFFEWHSTGLVRFNEDFDSLDRSLRIQGGRLVPICSFWEDRRKDVQCLMTLLREVRSLVASDPRDKIYSMLNFATDVHGSEITPDYTTTVRQTYTKVVLWFICKYKCLDILGECSPSLKDDAAPSWVPNWDEEDLVTPFTKTYDPSDAGSSSLYRASGNHERALNIQHALDVNTRLLVLSGVKVAKLDFVLNKVARTDEEWDEDRDEEWDEDRDEEWDEEWDERWAVHKTWAPKNGAALCSLNTVPMREVFRRTIYLDLHIFAPGFYFARGNYSPLPWDMERSALHSEHGDLKLDIQAAGSRRCPFYTTPGIGSSQGLLGYSIITARPGDELWILKGGKMPFILRPKAVTMRMTDLETGEAFDHPVNAGMPTYELVGEAFVLGLMDGEIIDMLGETPRRERPPPLADMDKDFRTIGLI